MNLVLLGTGTPAPSLTRQSSGYLIEIGTDRLVFDHGPGAHARLLESGRRAVEVTHAFFSHLHYDHCLDYPRLVLQRWDQGADRIPDLQVVGPPPIARMTSQLFDADGVFGPDIRARQEHPSSVEVFRARGGTPPRPRPAPVVREVRAGDVVQGHGWTVTVGHAAHVQPYLECIAYRIEEYGAAVCYSGDSGAVPELLELARGCDVLLLMNHYLSGTRAATDFRTVCGNHRDNAALAQEAGVATLVLTHLPAELDTRDVRDRILREIRENYEGRVIWGEDLMEIKI